MSRKGFLLSVILLRDFHDALEVSTGDSRELVLARVQETLPEVFWAGVERLSSDLILLVFLEFVVNLGFLAFGRFVSSGTQQIRRIILKGHKYIVVSARGQ